MQNALPLLRKAVEKSGAGVQDANTRGGNRYHSRQPKEAYKASAPKGQKSLPRVLTLVYRLAYNGDVVAGQLAVFQGANAKRSRTRTTTKDEDDWGRKEASRKSHTRVVAMLTRLIDRLALELRNYPK
jgi:hypothetical protein